MITRLLHNQRVYHRIATVSGANPLQTPTHPHHNPFCNYIYCYYSTSTQNRKASGFFDRIMSKFTTSSPRRSPGYGEAHISIDSWFQDLFGVHESQQSVARFSFDEDSGTLTAPNGFQCKTGSFATPSVQELREQVEALKESLPDHIQGEPLRVRHVASDSVIQLHGDKDSLNATFQAASQFNCLEFPSPRVTPEDGIREYVYDRTQGPACALACVGGTFYRNYVVPLGSQVGQSEDLQINNFSDVEDFIDNGREKYWIPRNGYVLVGPNAKKKLDPMIRESPEMAEDIIQRLRIGVQFDAEVVFTDSGHSLYKPPRTDPPHVVTQAYCSAMSLDYHNDPTEIAACVLKGDYEATLLTAIINAHNHGWSPSSRKVYLTRVGGGVFCNRAEWINDAIVYACNKYASFGIEVCVVHFRRLVREDVHAINAGLTKDIAIVQP